MRPWQCRFRYIAVDGTLLWHAPACGIDNPLVSAHALRHGQAVSPRLVDAAVRVAGRAIPSGNNIGQRNDRLQTVCETGTLPDCWAGCCRERYNRAVG